MKPLNFDQKVSVEEVIVEAEDRYLNDAEFSALVYLAVEQAYPKGLREGLTLAMREVATQAASYVLVLEEKLERKD